MRPSVRRWSEVLLRLLKRPKRERAAAPHSTTCSVSPPLTDYWSAPIPLEELTFPAACITRDGPLT